MKRISIKIAMAALLLAVGTLGVNAQIGRGGACLATGTTLSGTTTGTCIYTQLTEEQKAILHDLFVAYQADMTELRTEMRATFVLSEKLAIRAKMTELREAHLAEVKALLKEWGIGG